jgi:hypothetical protein
VLYECITGKRPFERATAVSAGRLRDRLYLSLVRIREFGVRQEKDQFVVAEAELDETDVGIPKID